MTQNVWRDTILDHQNLDTFSLFIIIIRFDIYRKVPKDLTQPTLTGACISLCSVAFMTYLFLSELAAFIIPEM